MIAIIDTSDRPCWLAEACKILLLLLLHDTRLAMNNGELPDLMLTHTSIYVWPQNCRPALGQLEANREGGKFSSPTLQSYQVNSTQSMCTLRQNHLQKMQTLSTRSSNLAQYKTLLVRL